MWFSCYRSHVSFCFQSDWLRADLVCSILVALSDIYSRVNHGRLLTAFYWTEQIYLYFDFKQLFHRWCCIILYVYSCLEFYSWRACRKHWAVFLSSSSLKPVVHNYIMREVSLLLICMFTLLAGLFQNIVIIGPSHLWIQVLPMSVYT